MDFEVNTVPVGDGNAILIAVDGELDIATCERARPTIDDAIRAGRPLVLDLSGCPFIDSTGLRLVLHTYNGLDREDGREPSMAVVVGDSRIHRMFSLTAIDQSVPVFGARDDAVAWLMGQRRPKGKPGFRSPLIR